jgi:hypothetical protein
MENGVLDEVGDEEMGEKLGPKNHGECGPQHVLAWQRGLFRNDFSFSQ